MKVLITYEPGHELFLKPDSHRLFSASANKDSINQGRQQKGQRDDQAGEHDETQALLVGVIHHGFAALLGLQGDRVGQFCEFLYIHGTFF